MCDSREGLDEQKQCSERHGPPSRLGRLAESIQWVQFSQFYYSQIKSTLSVHASKIIVTTFQPEVAAA